MDATTFFTVVICCCCCCCFIFFCIKNEGKPDNNSKRISSVCFGWLAVVVNLNGIFSLQRLEHLSDTVSTRSLDFSTVMQLCLFARLFTFVFVCVYASVLSSFLIYNFIFLNKKNRFSTFQIKNLTFDHYHDSSNFGRPENTLSDLKCCCCCVFGIFKKVWQKAYPKKILIKILSLTGQFTAPLSMCVLVKFKKAPYCFVFF